MEPVNDASAPDSAQEPGKDPGNDASRDESTSAQNGASPPPNAGQHPQHRIINHNNALHKPSEHQPMHPGQHGLHDIVPKALDNLSHVGNGIHHPQTHTSGATPPVQPLTKTQRRRAPRQRQKALEKSGSAVIAPPSNRHGDQQHAHSDLQHPHGHQQHAHDSQQHPHGIQQHPHGDHIHPTHINISQHPTHTSGQHLTRGQHNTISNHQSGSLPTHPNNHATAHATTHATTHATVHAHGLGGAQKHGHRPSDTPGQVPHITKPANQQRNRHPSTRSAIAHPTDAYSHVAQQHSTRANIHSSNGQIHHDIPGNHPMNHSPLSTQSNAAHPTRGHALAQSTTQLHRAHIQGQHSIDHAQGSHPSIHQTSNRKVMSTPPGVPINIHFVNFPHTRDGQHPAVTINGKHMGTTTSHGSRANQQRARHLSSTHSDNVHGLGHSEHSTHTSSHHSVHTSNTGQHNGTTNQSNFRLTNANFAFDAKGHGAQNRSANADSGRHSAASRQSHHIISANSVSTSHHIPPLKSMASYPSPHNPHYGFVPHSKSNLTHIQSWNSVSHTTTVSHSTSRRDSKSTHTSKSVHTHESHSGAHQQGSGDELDIEIKLPLKDYSIGMQLPTESDESQLEQDQQNDPPEPDDHESVDYDNEKLEHIVADDHDGQHKDAEHEDPLMTESKNGTISAHAPDDSPKDTEGDDLPPPGK